MQCTTIKLKKKQIHLIMFARLILISSNSNGHTINWAYDKFTDLIKSKNVDRIIN